jgi:hypothetical protein
MRNHQVAARQQQRLRHIAFDPDMPGLRPENGGVDLAPDGDDQIDRKIAQPGQRTLEQIAGFEMEHGAERQIDGRPVGRQPGKPARRRAFDGVQDRRPDQPGRVRQRMGGIAEGGWQRREHQMPAQHRHLRIWREPVGCPQRVQGSGNELRPDLRPGCDHENRGMRQAEALGRDHGAKIHLVADQEIRPPTAAEVEQRRGPVARHPAGEAVAHRPILPRGIEGQQRRPGG